MAKHSPSTNASAEREEFISEALARAGAPAELLEPVSSAVAQLVEKFFEQMALRAPRHLPVVSALTEDDRNVLRRFYAQYEHAAIESIILATLEIELGRARPAKPAPRAH